MGSYLEVRLYYFPSYFLFPNFRLHWPFLPEISITVVLAVVFSISIALPIRNYFLFLGVYLISMCIKMDSWMFSACIRRTLFISAITVFFWSVGASWRHLVPFVSLHHCLRIDCITARDVPGLSCTFWPGPAFSQFTKEFRFILLQIGMLPGFSSLNIF